MYERRRPLDLDKFADFAANWPDAVIRTKGMVWVNEQPDICYLLEQAGSQRCFIENGSFVAALPADETPATTGGRKGFYHLTDLSGNVEAATLRYILRDHDAKKLEEKKRAVEKLVATFNEKYGGGTVGVEIRDQYRNMKEKIDETPFVVDLALEATKECGVTPISEPIRGGTDGANLTWQGLPCPNLGTGGFGFHGPYEHITIEGMDVVVKILHAIVRRVAEMKK